jgi:protein disulfide-isomerase
MSSAQSNKETMQTKKITIEIWSDIVCPFCYIGKKKLETAIAKLDAVDQVKIIWHSFQLDPDFPMDTSISTNDYLVKRKGYPHQQVSTMIAQLVEQGKEYNIDFHFDKSRTFNTSDAHRLIQWAKSEGKSNEFKEALMLSYFTDGLDLSVTNNLLIVLEKVGLDLTKAKHILETNAYADDLARDIYEAQQLGIRGVPYFVINKNESISGAQSDKVFEITLAAALKSIIPSINGTKESICIPDEGCK